VEAVTFTNAVKSDLATTLRRAFEDRQLRIPIDQQVREDLHSVRRIVTAAGNIRFDAERDQASHADRFWALALALHAHSGGGYAPYEHHSVGRRGITARRR
jgi:phage FluMu gp28-like protein